MHVDESWDRLVERLNAWTSATALGPGRIRVTLPDDQAIEPVEILMTPEEWDDMSGVMWGDFDEAVEEVKRSIMGLQAADRFLIYSQYRLERSAHAFVPEDDDVTPGAGEWVTNDVDGRVDSRFATWREPSIQDSEVDGAPSRRD